MKPLFPSTPFVIDSTFNIEEARQLLKTYLRSHIWQTWRSKGFVGRISDDHIWIAIYHPGSRRALSPRFSGQFLKNDFGIKLTGKFHFSFFEKISVIFGIIGFTLTFIYAVIRSIFIGVTNESIFIMIGMPLVTIFLIKLVKISWKKRQNDVLEIKALLETVLKANGN